MDCADASAGVSGRICIRTGGHTSLSRVILVGEGS